MEAKSFDTLVIGSGPAGLLSSIGYSHNSHVTLLEKPEKNNTLGKRILLSGNGRCNFFNRVVATYLCSLFSSLNFISNTQIWLLFLKRIFRRNFFLS